MARPRWSELICELLAMNICHRLVVHLMQTWTLKRKIIHHSVRSLTLNNGWPFKTAVIISVNICLYTSLPLPVNTTDGNLTASNVAWAKKDAAVTVDQDRRRNKKIKHTVADSLWQVTAAVCLCICVVLCVEPRRCRVTVTRTLLLTDRPEACRALRKCCFSSWFSASASELLLLLGHFHNLSEINDVCQDRLVPWRKTWDLWPWNAVNWDNNLKIPHLDNCCQAGLTPSCSGSLWLFFMIRVKWLHKATILNDSCGAGQRQWVTDWMKGSSRHLSSGVRSNWADLPPAPRVLSPEVLQVHHRQPLHHRLSGVQRLRRHNVNIRQSNRINSNIFIEFISKVIQESVKIEDFNKI